MQKNVRVRTQMVRAGINQGDLARILGITDQECSVMLKYDLSKAEQDSIIEKIKARESESDKA